ncbi:MAG TPA: hypothetical protein VFT04_09755 [Gemmatimonadales bacterium]|nr:hypothetical protein [Gemmatimonadales bacterium]
MKAALVHLLLLLPASVEGQGVRHSFAPPAPDTAAPIRRLTDSLPRRDDLTLAFGGALGGIGGLLAGAFIGAQVERAGGCEYDDWCGFGGGLLGATIGSTVMIPAGVHLANDQRGDFGEGLVASAAALGGGIAISALVHDARPLLLIPIAQIISAVAVEKRTSCDEGEPRRRRSG